jgi:hypothetical protein
MTFRGRYALLLRDYLIVDISKISACTIKVSFSRNPLDESWRSFRNKNCEKPHSFNELENQCLPERKTIYIKKKSLPQKKKKKKKKEKEMIEK